MIPHDYHIHTNFSCDCQASMSEMCRAALTANISEIGFTEHLDLHPLDPDRDFFRSDEWWQEITRCREQYQGILTIRAGIELSEPHQHINIIEKLYQSYPWDYSLGSLHWFGNEMIFDHASFTRPEKDVYEDYFIELQRMVDVGNFDILAHMDMVKRYGYEHYGKFDPFKYDTMIQSVLKTVADKNIALEVNTASLRRSINETSPSKQILEWFHAQGGQGITLGSDAHMPQDVGAGIERALAAVKASGFNSVASFSQRQQTAIPL